MWPRAQSGRGGLCKNRSPADGPGGEKPGLGLSGQAKGVRGTIQTRRVSPASHKLPRCGQWPAGPRVRQGALREAALSPEWEMAKPWARAGRSGQVPAAQGQRAVQVLSGGGGGRWGQRELGAGAVPATALVCLSWGLRGRTGEAGDLLCVPP